MFVFVAFICESMSLCYTAKVFGEDDKEGIGRARSEVLEDN